MYLGSWKVDDLLTFTVTTHRFDTGVATDADSPPTYRVYEDETSTPILTGTMALLDSSNTAGFYSEQITLSAANGLEKGKSYNIYIAGTVNSVVAATSRTFQMEAEVDANVVSGGVNVTQFGGSNGTFSSGRPEVNTTLIEGSDATNQIRDSVVDDATRIDASALNTAAVTTIPTNLDATVSSRATQVSVDDLPTNAELATSQAAADDATLAAIAALNNLSAAQVNTEVDTALADIHLDHLLAATYDPASKPGAADALLNELVESDGGVARYTANALEQAPTGGSAPTAAEIVDEWEAQSQADPTGFHVNVKEINGTAQTANDVGADVNDILTDTAEIGAAGAGLTVLATAAELAKVPKSDSNVTWNATAAAQLQSEAADALNAYDPPTRAEATSDANSILTAVDAVPTNAELTAALAAADDAVLAAIAALNNLSTAQVLTQVNSALDTALTDSVPADGALPTLRQASYMIGQFLFERDVSGTTLTVKKVNGSTTLMTFTLNDASAPTSITRTT